MLNITGNKTSNKARIWRPFTQEYTADPGLFIDHAKGAWLYTKEQKPVLDLISSWWVNVHGHAHPEIAQAIYQQALKLEQVIFACCSHQPALDLAERLVALLPGALNHVFFSDNGSTAVEVALKMAFQFWQNQGKTEKKRFIAFQGGYHGDTFGAMAAGRSSGFFTPFHNLLFSVDFIDYPATWDDDPAIEQKEEASLQQLKKHLEQYAGETAALIIEPLIQGAAGMRFCRPIFLKRLLHILQEYQIISIFDEVMTGFGRTGTLFATEQCCSSKDVSHVHHTHIDDHAHVPDIICLSKGLTGGFLPLSVTVVQEKIYAGFLSKQIDHAFLHGHSYTANPLGCAAACASLNIFAKESVQEKIHIITATHRQGMESLKTLPLVKNTRVMGAIAALDLVLPDHAYGSNFSKILARNFLQAGLLLRPLGNVLYLMPPYIVTKKELLSAYAHIKECLQSLEEGLVKEDQDI